MSPDLSGNVAIPHAVLSEPGVSDPHHYARRVTWLAVVYPALTLTSLAGIVLLVWRGRFFVTLSQRSNVETLTIAFFLLFFAYFTFLTAPGALGAWRIARYRLAGRLARDRSRVEKRRLAALGKRGPGGCAAFDKAIELEGRRGGTWEIDVRDEVGSFGKLRVHGVRIELCDTFRGGSNSLLGYVAHKLCTLTGSDLSIVHWGSTHEEKLREFVTTSQALQAIGRKLDITSWPTVTLTEEKRRELERDVSKLCPALRDEAFLPDWEYEGEHKLPIIPEPLGIITLSRSERRVDPLSTMTVALGIVLSVVGLITYFLARPPWVPGH